MVDFLKNIHCFRVCNSAEQVSILPVNVLSRMIPVNDLQKVTTFIYKNTLCNSACAARPYQNSPEFHQVQVKGSGLRVKVQGSGFRVQGSGLRVNG